MIAEGLRNALGIWTKSAWNLWMSLVLISDSFGLYHGTYIPTAGSHHDLVQRMKGMYKAGKKRRGREMVNFRSTDPKRGKFA
jgi:hypothetical protein